MIDIINKVRKSKTTYFEYRWNDLIYVELNHSIKVRDNYVKSLIWRNNLKNEPSYFSW